MYSLSIEQDQTKGRKCITRPKYIPYKMHLKMDNGLGDAYLKTLFPEHLYVRQSGNIKLSTTAEHLKHYWRKPNETFIKTEADLVQYEAS